MGGMDRGGGEVGGFGKAKGEGKGEGEMSSRQRWWGLGLGEKRGWGWVGGVDIAEQQGEMQGRCGLDLDCSFSCIVCTGSG